MKSQSIFLQGLRDLMLLNKLAGVSLWVWLLPATLLLGSSALEGISVGLLVPFIEILTKGGDVAGLRTVPAISTLLEWFPGLRLRHLLTTVLVLICFAVSLKNLLSFIAYLFVSKTSRLIEHRLRTKIYDRLLGFGKEYFDRNRTGNLTDLTTSQVLTAVDVYHYMQYFYSNIIMSCVYFGMMVVISWRLTMLALIFFPVIHLIVSTISKKIQLSTADKFKIDQEMSSYMFDSLSNMPLIHASVTEQAESARYSGISDRSRLNHYSVWKKLIAAPLLQDTALNFVTAGLVACSVLVFMKRNDGFGIGAFITFFVVLRRFAQTSGQSGINATEMSRLFVPIRHILALFDDSDKPYVRSGAELFHGLKNEIRFEDVRLRYRGGQEVLKGSSFAIKKGKTTAIVGPTGGGKTSLVSLLMRFYDPTAGAIRVDGREIREWDARSFVRKIALVDQNALVFNRTIRENILYGSPRATSEALEEAVKKAALQEVIETLPLKFDTLIGDRGTRLSGGERQRLAIARAILKDPDIYIFDEATSSLDVQTEQSIQAAIENATKDKTVIVIAHRLSTIKNADHIVVIQSGAVVEEGSFSSLRSGNGPFRHYWDLLLQDPARKNEKQNLDVNSL